MLTHDEERRLELAHKAEQVDELEHRVILNLVNDEVADVQALGQRHPINHLVRKDDL